MCSKSIGSRVTGLRLLPAEFLAHTCCEYARVKPAFVYRTSDAAQGLGVQSVLSLRTKREQGLGFTVNQQFREKAATDLIIQLGIDKSARLDEIVHPLWPENTSRLT